MTDSPEANLAGSINAHDNTCKRKKGRGRFKGVDIFKKIKAYENARLPVQMDMKFKRPYGQNADSLVGEISRLVKLFASYDVPFWRDVPEERKAKIYEKIWDKFELKLGDEVRNDDDIREAIYGEAGRRYRDYRCTLHKHYLSKETDEARLQNPPEDLNTEEWAWLVNYYGSPKFQEMSARNKRNRSKQVISHVTGRRSFKQVSWGEQNEGDELLPHELWRLTHQRKDGSWGSDQSRYIYETVKEKLESSLNAGDFTVTHTPDEIFTSVVGQRSGYIRGMGSGPRPPPKSTVMATTIAGLKAQVRDRDEQISKMEEVMGKQGEEMVVIKEKLSKQKEEVTAQVTAEVTTQVTAEVTTRLQLEMTSKMNELVNKKFMDMLSQVYRGSGSGM